MPNNNPAGTNSPVAFDQFSRQIPYGEKKVQGDLQRTVPLAGSSAAATPLNLPRAAQRAATRPTTTSSKPATSPGADPLQPPPELPPVPTPAEMWQQLLSVPGISPLAFDYAARAAK